MADIRANTNVLYCAKQNPYDEPRLQMQDAYHSLEEGFPDVCLQSHWDPSALADRYILPRQEAPLPTSYLPFTRICLEYTTADRGSGLSGDDLAQKPILLGGRASTDFPYKEYATAVDRESDLLGLPRPLVKYCEGRYVPTTQNQQAGCPEAKVMTVTQEKILGEVNRPKATVRTTPFDCRDSEDVKNGGVSRRLFNNPTRYDRQEKANLNARENNEPKTVRYLTPGFTA
jgi:hypothetical protein